MYGSHEQTKRDYLSQAAQGAGLHVLEYIEKPVAVAFAYGKYEPSAQKAESASTMLNYLAETTHKTVNIHLGGRTLYVTYLTGNRIISTNEDRWLGGTDFANELVEYACDMYEEVDDEENIELDITREKFNEINQVHLAKIIPVVVGCLRDGNVTVAEIDHVFLSGGAIQTPAVMELLSDFFKRDIDIKVKPDEAAAAGAAIFA